MWTNYHSHCYFCDGNSHPEEYARAALERKMAAYGYSSHAPVPFGCQWTMKKARLKAYFKNIKSIKEAYSNHIEIYAGLETDFIPQIMGPEDFMREGWDIDYTIGSIHFVGQFEDGRYWEVDGNYDVFLEGLEHIYNGDIQQVIHHYYARTRDMVEQSCPDVIGHLDKIKMQNKDSIHFSESDDWYKAEVLDTLSVIAKSKAIIEVNTRGLYKTICDEPYPSLWILDAMRTLNIPVTLSSDAHKPEEVDADFEQTAVVLMNCGYEEVRVLLNNQWTDVTFDENGLHL